MVHDIDPILLIVNRMAPCLEAILSGFRRHSIHIPRLAKHVSLCNKNISFFYYQSKVRCWASPSSCEDEYLFGLDDNPSNNTE